MMDVFTSGSQPWDKMDPKLQKHSHGPTVWLTTSPRLAMPAVNDRAGCAAAGARIPAQQRKSVVVSRKSKGGARSAY